MTASQHIKFYDFFRQQLNIDDAKAKVFVEEVEKLIEQKFDSEKQNFASMSSLEKVDFKIDMLRQEVKTIAAETKSEIKSEINKLIVWIIATMFASGAFFITLAKIFL
ncbi:hypothetical protein ACFOW1_13445 [Parasediminibacterium paludis]|uniref:DUF1640 domain-containing protein n=1 Tax=Parasediminibacterium paludis TaxID=908966 RepID=A0ABV8Q1V1_9BACT